MSTNLAPDYVQFVDNKGRIDHLVQEVIDRAQYHPGFLDFLELLLKDYESPFEWVDTEDGRVRRLKPNFIKGESEKVEETSPEQ
jgi:hypothetical protein